MKKQILILSVLVVSTVLFSCSKEKLDRPANEQANNEEMVAPNRPAIDPLSVKLEGWYTFDRTLKDQAQKLPNAISTAKSVSYDTDRKGKASGAISFTGSYHLSIDNVPQQTNTSISVWVKYSNPVNSLIGVVYGLRGPNVVQVNNEIFATIVDDSSSTNGGTTGLQVLDNNWHHVVITSNGSTIKIYTDGALKTTVNYPAIITPCKITYFVGAQADIPYNWKGSVDDLRFYSRTLTATDVQALYGTALDTSVQ
jgi:hypothetical protein